MNMSLTQVWRRTSAFCLDFAKLEQPVAAPGAALL
jgi:hypothetical protein